MSRPLVSIPGLMLTVSVALAAQPDPRGWSAGTIAAGAAEVTAGPDQLPIIDLPASLTRQLEGPTVLFYFSPTCPHCRHVAREVVALHERLSATGTATVHGIASASSTDSALAAFRSTYGVSFPITHDADRTLLAALAVRSTPSALLVVPAGRGKVEVRDLWYPFVPGLSALVEGRARGDVSEAFRPGAYLGNNFCGTCHTQEHSSWLLTHHAVAWRTLTTRDAHTDSACVRCHVTGAGQPGGFSGDPESRLVDVGCEACHGPGGPHDGVRTEAASTCASCHDEDHSIAFSYAKGLPLIDHFESNTLDEAQIRQRRLDLYQGEAPRELLAFPQGRNVGASRCLECHQTQHAWWSSDPHARAMDRLRPDGGDDPGCVRCHATSDRSGPPPTELSGYRILEGIGCESCHGPGEAHVAAGGGADNIEGLGEDCPVCVIEAVCTRCHTSERDPDWDLQQALGRIEH
ncbi:MAG TPA: redoxin domain-containing protein [Deltaproteobacteria bacterium]|nr:redoxin domain-containing protein [Deltaproteobacteria bacterium]